MYKIYFGYCDIFKVHHELVGTLIISQDRGPLVLFLKVIF